MNPFKPAQERSRSTARIQFQETDVELNSMPSLNSGTIFIEKRPEPAVFSSNLTFSARVGASTAAVDQANDTPLIDTRKMSTSFGDSKRMSDSNSQISANDGFHFTVPTFGFNAASANSKDEIGSVSISKSHAAKGRRLHLDNADMQSKTLMERVLLTLTLTAESEAPAKPPRNSILAARKASFSLFVPRSSIFGSAADVHGPDLAVRQQHRKKTVAINMDASLSLSFIQPANNSKVATARERAIMAQLAKAAYGKEQKAVLAQKMQDAIDRRNFLDQIKISHRVCMWLAIVSVASFVSRAKHLIVTARRNEEASSNLQPLLRRWFRRKLRHVRTRLCAGRMKVPTLFGIKFDKMFSLFSDSHLQHFIDRMKLRYYFENEAIVFKESEDDEAFALAEGSADVMVGKTKVFTLKPGMFFGSIGMISSEPRSATIIAREPSVCWVGNRADFESYGVKDSQLTVAHSLIAELRQKNMRTVYTGMLLPENICKFDIFKTVPLDAVASLITSGEPRAFKVDEILLPPTRPTLHATEAILLLRGRVQLLAHKDRISTKEGQERLREDLAWVVDLHNKKAEIEMVPPRPPGEEFQTLRGFVVVAECLAPCLIALPSVITGEFRGIAVQGISSTDALVIHRNKILSVDILALAQIRQNCLNIHCKFMKPVSKEVLVNTMFPSVISFDFLNSLKLHQMVLTPWVLSPGDRIMFNEESQFEMYIIVSGELDDGSNVLPRLWPEIYLGYFGCVACVAQCSTKVVVWRFRRAQLTQRITDHLKEGQQSVLVEAVGALFVSKRGKKPFFVDSQNPNATLGKKFTRMNMRRMNALRLNATSAANKRMSQANLGGNWTAPSKPTTKRRSAITFDYNMSPIMQSMRILKPHNVDTANRNAQNPDVSPKETAFAAPRKQSIFGMFGKMESSVKGRGSGLDKSMSESAMEESMSNKFAFSTNEEIRNIFSSGSSSGASLKNEATSHRKKKRVEAKITRPIFARLDAQINTPRPPVPQLPKEAKPTPAAHVTEEKDEWLHDVEAYERQQKHNRKNAAQFMPQRFVPTAHPAPARSTISEQREGSRQQATPGPKTPSPATGPVVRNIPHRPLTAGSARPSSGFAAQTPTTVIGPAGRPMSAMPQRFVNRLDRLEARLMNDIFGDTQK